MKRKYKGKAMGKPKTQKERVITIDDKQYVFDKLTEEQQFNCNMLGDLENKLANAKWNYDQLAGGREHFMGKLRKSLGHPELSDEEKQNI